MEHPVISLLQLASLPRKSALVLPDRLSRTKAPRRKMLAAFMARVLCPESSWKRHCTYPFWSEPGAGRTAVQAPPAAPGHRPPWLLIDPVVWPAGRAGACPLCRKDERHTLALKCARLRLSPERGSGRGLADSLPGGPVKRWGGFLNSSLFVCTVNPGASRALQFWRYEQSGYPKPFLFFLPFLRCFPFLFFSLFLSPIHRA